MESNAVRLWILLMALLASFVLNGCTSLPDKTVRFAGLSDCGPAKILLAQPQTLGPASSTHRLQCALTAVRESSDPTLLKSPLPSRLALHLAERSTNAAEKDALANEGVALAERALVQGASSDGAVHYYLAANLGLAIHDHPLLAADNLSRLEQELKKATDLTPSVDDGGPLRLLGMLYLKAPPWPTGIGDGDKALELLKKAADDYTDHPLNHLFYGQALWEVEEKLTSANQQLAMGREKLHAGPWGHNKPIWDKEFNAVAMEVSASSR
jgi:hypothetical protein